MSIREGIVFRELQRQMVVVLEEQAAQARRLAALEAGECSTCAQRRAIDAARQRRRRSRDRRAGPVERALLGGNAVKSGPRRPKELIHECAEEAR
jgi:hypothetical protein